MAYIWYNLLTFDFLALYNDISDILAFCTITGILSDLRSGLASRRTKEEEREQFNAWKIIMLNRQIINKWVIFYGYVEIPDKKSTDPHLTGEEQRKG